MADPPLSTMALPKAAAPSRVTQPVCNAPPNAPPPSSKENLVTQDLDLTLRTFFPTPTVDMLNGFCDSHLTPVVQ